MSCLDCPKCGSQEFIAFGQVEGQFIGFMAKPAGKIFYCPARVIVTTDAYLQHFSCAGCGVRLAKQGEKLVAVEANKGVIN